MYGIEKTNEIFKELRVADKSCREGMHLHGSLDGSKLGVACVPACAGKFLATPRTDGNGIKYKCLT